MSRIDENIAFERVCRKIAISGELNVKKNNVKLNVEK